MIALAFLAVGFGRKRPAGAVVGQLVVMYPGKGGNGPCPSCTRVGAFSSPNYTLSGVTIGTASRNDNNRVWRTRGPTVAGFR